MKASYTLPSAAPMRISLVDAVGNEGFQAMLSMATPFNLDKDLGCLD